MSGQRFDDLTRATALPLSRRKLVSVVFGGLIASLAGAWFTGSNPFDRESGLTCGACRDVVGAANFAKNDGPCDGIIATLKACRQGGWQCLVAATGVCMIAKAMPDVDEDTICSSSNVEKITRQVGLDRAPCDGLCEVDEENCPTTGRCVPRCGEDQRLAHDPDGCACVDELEAQAGSGEKQAPLRSAAATGRKASQRWQFVVPQEQVLIVGAHYATVNGIPFGSEGVLAAYGANSPVDMTIGDGFWTVVDEELAQSFYCGQAHPPAGKSPMRYTSFMALDEWGGDACGNDVSPIPTFRTTGHSYTSPFYGHRLNWDDSWSVTMNNSWWVGGPDGGFDQIQLTNGVSIVAVTGSADWHGNGGVCLTEVSDGIEGWLGMSWDVTRTDDFSDAPLGIRAAHEQSAVYQYTFVSPYGPQTRIAYVDCVTLPSGRENLVFLFDAPIDQYNAQLGARDELVARLDVPW